MTPPASSTDSTKAIRLLLAISGVAAMILAGVVGKSIGKEGVRHLLGRSEAQPKAINAAAWATRSWADIELDLPFELRPGPDISAKIPASVMESLDYFDMKTGGDAAANFQVSVSRIAYKPDVLVSLDGSINGAVTYAARAVGDNNPDFTTQELTLNGLAAIKASYSRKLGRQVIRLETLAVRKDQRIWQVQAVFSSEVFSNAVNRTLSSVRIVSPN